jgi:hypothetical protein
VIATSYILDLHHFRGSFGGKDVIPLYRDAAGTEPNVTAGLLDKLGEKYGAVPSAEDLAAYLCAVLGGQSYTSRFWNELETPGPRVPLTKDGQIFAEAAALGRRLIWLHTYAERFRGEGRGDEVPMGAAKNVKAYRPARRTIRRTTSTIRRSRKSGSATACSGPSRRRCGSSRFRGSKSSSRGSAIG